VGADGRRAHGERRLVWVGRATVAGVAAVSVLWLPLIPLLGDQLFVYIQKPPSYLAPPVLVLFLWGVLCPRERVTGAGAAVALALGLGLGFFRFVFELAEDFRIAKSDGALSKGCSFGWFTRVHYLMFCWWNFLLSSAVLFAASAQTERLERWWSAILARFAPDLERKATSVRLRSAVSRLAAADANALRDGVGICATPRAPSAAGADPDSPPGAYARGEDEAEDALAGAQQDAIAPDRLQWRRGLFRVLMREARYDAAATPPARSLELPELSPGGRADESIRQPELAVVAFDDDAGGGGGGDPGIAAGGGGDGARDPAIAQLEWRLDAAACVAIGGFLIVGVLFK